MCKFSICIPSYNRAHTIQKPLDSLVRQSFKDFEVLVIDDGSKDNTEEVVSHYKSILNLRYIKKENGGKHTALNKGIKCANGELFIILDSDDWLVDTCLEKMAQIWQRCQNKETYCGLMGKSMSNGRMIGCPFPETIKELSYVEYHYGKYAGMFLDCCESIRTDILKNYSWPENLDTKFIPENYVMDQIGLKFKLILTNEILMEKVYENDGITNNLHEFIKKNISGYLFNTISKIDIILPNAHKTEVNSFALRNLWYSYWQLVDIDIEKKGPRIKSISMIGYLMLIRNKLTQLLNKLIE